MVKEMKRRDVLKKFKANGIEFLREGKGDHDVWVCTCGEEHQVTITETREISPGVIRDVINKMPCQEKGWLQ